MSHARLSYRDMFYKRLEKGKFIGTIKGFPQTRGSWCKKLKIDYVDLQGNVLSAAEKQRNIRVSANERELVQQRLEDAPLKLRQDGAQKKNIVYYVGIAADEPLRIARHIEKPDKVLPLVQIGWDEALCGLEAQYMDMLSPTYTTSMRDGCWFCHNQGVAQLRNLRKSYPDLWGKLLALDNDSPVSFHPDGRTVHDFDRRFRCEDEGIIYADERFKWADIEQPQMRLF